MRRLLTGLAVAALTTVASALALAGDQDQQVAKQIAANMQNSGRLVDYKVGVNYRNGTAWLSGKVRNEEQMVTALKIALETPGVEKVVNNLSTGDAGMKSLPAPAHPGRAARGQLRSRPRRFSGLRRSSRSMPRCRSRPRGG